MGKDLPEAAIDPDYWHPKAKNFEILDWDKWLATNPKAPEVFDPPQAYTFYGYKHSLLLWWSRRTFPLCQPLVRPLIPCCSPTKMTGAIDDKDQSIYWDLLGPSPDSSKIPSAFRNTIFWTDFNSVPETLVSMNRWSWRSQTPEGRVIGLGSLKYDWTRDRTLWGLGFTFGAVDVKMNVQASPDQKWLSIQSFRDPTDPEATVNWIFFYVVQEGEVYKDKDGKVIDYLKPGDLIRCTWNKLDPYDTAELTYNYHPRRVAHYNEETQAVEIDPVHHKALLEKATKDEDCGWKSKTCCGCSGLLWCVSSKERYNHDVTYLPKHHSFQSGPTPVMGDAIERL